MDSMIAARVVSRAVPDFETVAPSRFDALSSPSVILVVGEAQPIGGRAPLQGRTGDRLFRFAGRPDLQKASRRGEPLDGVVAVNLYDIPGCVEPGCLLSDEGPYLHTIGHVLSEMRIAHGSFRVLALGRRVSRALRLTHLHLLSWSEPPPGDTWSVAGVSACAFVPHPSPSNRWWNNLEHARRGALFLKESFDASNR